MAERARTISIWDPGIVRQAIVDSFVKVDPRVQIKNPVMFIVEVGSLITTIIFVQELAAGTGRPLFTGQVAFWLWWALFNNNEVVQASGWLKQTSRTLGPDMATSLWLKIPEAMFHGTTGNRSRAC